MMFQIRLIVFSILILLGFGMSVHSVKMRKTVTFVYAITLLWYTFLCRMPAFVLTVHAEEVVPQPEPSVHDSVLMLLKMIFGMQNGNLADTYPHAFVLNIMLFIPSGYLILMRLNEAQKDNRKNAGFTVILVFLESFCIECLQQITGLGMFDRMDITGNTIGGMIGILMVIGYRLFDMRRKRNVL